MGHAGTPSDQLGFLFSGQEPRLESKHPKHPSGISELCQTGAGDVGVLVHRVG